ncbi:MAG: hypothetical protein WBB17_08030, partial [Saprospiraceae bacterium]
SDPSATNTVPPQSASICNQVEFNGFIMGCDSDSIPITKTSQACITLPSAPPSASIIPTLKCYTLDPSADEHKLIYKIKVLNTGLVPISSLSLQYNLKNQIQGDINVLSSQINSTKVINSTTGLAVIDSLRYGLGNNGVFTGWNSNTTNTYDTEILTPQGTTVPNLLVNESIEIEIEFIVKIAQTFNNNGSSRWIDRNHCALLNGRATLTFNSNSIFNTSQTYVCPLVVDKYPNSNVSVVEIDPVLGNQYSANWYVNIYKSPDLIINNISLKDNFELFNSTPKKIEVISTNYVATGGLAVIDTWDGETPYNPTDISTTPNEYILNPNRSLDWPAGPYSDPSSKTFNIYVGFNTIFRYLYGTDPTSTNTIPPEMASICNRVEFSGDIMGCASDSIHVSILKDTCIMLPIIPQTGSVTNNLSCYTLDQSNDIHTFQYNLKVSNSGLIPLTGISLQYNLKNQIQGNINILSSEIISTKVINTTSGLAVTDSLRYGLGNNGVFTGWDSNTSNLFDTEVLSTGTMPPALNVGESIIVMIRFKAKIVQTFLNISSSRWIDQNHCVLLNGRSTLSNSTNLNTVYNQLPTYLCPVEGKKTLSGSITVQELNPVIGNTYSANWFISINKSPDMLISDITLKDNFEQSNPFPEAVEILTTNIFTTNGLSAIDAWDGETPYISNHISTTPNDYLTNPNRKLDWLIGASTDFAQRYTLIYFGINTTFRYLYGTDPAATNTVSPANALIENEARFTGIIAGCGDIPDQPIFISAKASVSPINVVPPGNSFVKQFKNLA